MTDKELYIVAGLIHEAKMLDCYGKDNYPAYRAVWPKTFKEFRGLQSHGQSFIDISLAQARALEPFLDMEKIRSLAEVNDHVSPH